jgi:sterol desaturase/sphingolipid hydroxylase (fatty acid hydroxylase superfamily)
MGVLSPSEVASPLVASRSIPLILLTNFVTQAAAYFAVVSVVYFVVWRWGRERFASARIATTARADRAQLRHELGHTLVTLVVGMLSAGSVLALHATGRARLTDAPASPLAVLAWVAAGLVFNDAWFYGWHRLLHHPRLYRHVHAVHHRSVDVTPFSSYSFHAVEGLVLGAWIVPAAVFLPVPVAALGALQVIGLANNVMSHLGYEFAPRWLLRVPLLRWSNTATFHSLHHRYLRGNFGLHSRLWDRLFGTEIPDYERAFVERGARDGEAGDARVE